MFRSQQSPPRDAQGNTADFVLSRAPQLFGDLVLNALEAKLLAEVEKQRTS